MPNIDFILDKKNLSSSPLLPEDYYLNAEGLMVFTQAYHLKRGNCCKSGCLHCPWGYKKKKSLHPNPLPEEQK